MPSGRRRLLPLPLYHVVQLLEIRDSLLDFGLYLRLVFGGLPLRAHVLQELPPVVDLLQRLLKQLLQLLGPRAGRRRRPLARAQLRRDLLRRHLRRLPPPPHHRHQAILLRVVHRRLGRARHGGRHRPVRLHLRDDLRLGAPPAPAQLVVEVRLAAVVLQLVRRARAAPHARHRHLGRRRLGGAHVAARHRRCTQRTPRRR
mmetsp:Transcript_37132/g.93840  ORF Transcript_37132/g.93840 Transcript_37132/m.93840 type:complete len:201 (-) Transcript_37132:419-1021(-)